jgi:hypothetical protein
MSSSLLPLVPEQNSEFDTYNYEKKQEATENSFTTEDIAELGNKTIKSFKNDVGKGSSWAYNRIKSAVTPGFIKRSNKKKVHIESIQKEEK